jgi:hypothetical protein
MASAQTRRRRDPVEWMTPKQAADYLHLAEGTLRNMRVAGRGPRYRKLPNDRIRYTRSDLDDWSNGDQP